MGHCPSGEPDAGVGLVDRLEEVDHWIEVGPREAGEHREPLNCRWIGWGRPRRPFRVLIRLIAIGKEVAVETGSWERLNLAHPDFLEPEEAGR